MRTFRSLYALYAVHSVNFVLLEQEQTVGGDSRCRAHSTASIPQTLVPTIFGKDKTRSLSPRYAEVERLAHATKGLINALLIL